MSGNVLRENGIGGNNKMDAIILFIIRLFTAAFYTLIFLGALAVAAFIVWITEEQGKRDKK